MIAGFGPTSLELFTRSNRHFASSKTCGDLFLAEASSPFLLTLPTSGSMRSGACCQRPPLVLPTSESASSSWPTATAQDADSSSGSRAEWKHGETLTDASRTWGSPVASDHRRGSASTTFCAKSLVRDAMRWKTPHGFQAGNGPDGNEFSKAVRAWQTPAAENFRSRGGDRVDEAGLDRQATMWATPVAACGSKGSEDPELKAARQKVNGGGTSDLLIQAQQWPTPNAMVSNDGETPESWERRKQRMLELGINGNGLGMPLAIAATTWPTPTSTPDNSQNNSNQVNGPTSLGRATKMWPTPMAADDGDKVTPASHQGGLTVMVRDWPTPAARDYRSPNSEPYSERGGGLKGEQLANFAVFHSLPQDLETTFGEDCSMQVVSVGGSELSPTKRAGHVLGRRRLNPAFVCWLMGWPWWWTRAEPTSFGAVETALWRSRLQWHLSSLLGAR